MKKLQKSWFLQHWNCKITWLLISTNPDDSKVSPFGKMNFTIGISLVGLLQQQQFAQTQQHSPHFKISECKYDFNQNPPKKNRLSAALITKNPTRSFHKNNLLQTWNTMPMSVSIWSLSSSEIQQIPSSIHKCDDLDDLRCCETKIKIKRSETKCSQIEMW